MSTETDSPPSSRDRLALISIGIAILTVIAAGFACYALRKILTPLLLSVFLLLVIGGLETALTRWTPLPRRAALPAAIVAVVALFGVSIWLFAENAAGIVAQSSVYAARLDEILTMFSDRFGLETAPTIDQLFHKLNPARFASIVARGAGHILDGAVFVLIYLGFMLASREGFQGQGRTPVPRSRTVRGGPRGGRPHPAWRPELCGWSSDRGRSHHRRRLASRW